MASIERYLGREREVGDSFCLFFTWRLILCNDGVENERMEFLDLVINIMAVMEIIRTRGSSLLLIFKFELCIGIF